MPVQYLSKLFGKPGHFTEHQEEKLVAKSFILVYAKFRKNLLQYIWVPFIAINTAMEYIFDM